MKEFKKYHHEGGCCGRHQGEQGCCGEGRGQGMGHGHGQGGCGSKGKHQNGECCGNGHGECQNKHESSGCCHDQMQAEDVFGSFKSAEEETMFLNALKGKIEERLNEINKK